MPRRTHTYGSGSVWKTDDPRRKKKWVAQIYLGVDSQGKARFQRSYHATQAEARTWCAEQLRRLQAGQIVPSPLQNLGDYLTRWLEEAVRPTVRPGTYDDYARLVRLHILPALGTRPLGKLTPLDLMRLYRTIQESGRSARTTQYVHAVLHRALDQAVRWGLIPRNVADLVDPPRPARTEMQPLTVEQVKRFLEAARDDRLHALYVLAVTTGLRIGELLALQWGDLDTERGTLHVQRSLRRTSAGLVFQEPKSARSRRVISLPTLALAALRQHRARQLEERLKLGTLWDDHDLIFPNEVGRPIERQNLIRRSFKKLLQQAGLPAIRFHDLRHTAATLLLSLGEHPKVVQERLGHSTIAVTMDVYSHVLPDLQREAAAKLDRLLHDSRTD
ncbi:MAG: site-specific integrase [Chloroflexi bacterium]|nr:site-specific integrase [Chloroflexota bacterium]